MGKEFLNLASKDYYSQTNNEYNPFEACKPTSRIMFYVGNGFSPKFPSSKYKQEEDRIMEILHTAEAKSWCKSRGYSEEVITDPNLDNLIYPLYLDKILFGKSISDFTNSMSLTEMVYRICSGQVLMTSGEFDYYSNKQKNVIKISHSICIIGVNDLGFLLADPYNKDYKTAYREGKGYKVQMSFKDAEKYLKILIEKFPDCSEIKTLSDSINSQIDNPDSNLGKKEENQEKSN